MSVLASMTMKANLSRLFFFFLNFKLDMMDLSLESRE